MTSPETVSVWLAQVKQGDQRAAQALWDRYFPDLLRMAASRLRSVPDQVADEEDVVLSALNSFFNAARQNRFPDLSDRECLWRLLSRITHQKAVNAVRRTNRLKRGGNTAVRIMGLPPADSDLSGMVDQQLGPDLVVMVAEECQLLFDRLPDEQLKEIARAKMEGFTNAEIAQRLNCSQRTIERRVRLIRKIWESEDPIE